MNHGNESNLWKPISRNWDWIGITYLGASLLLAVMAQLALKYGVTEWGGIGEGITFGHLAQLLANAPVSLGIALHVLDILFWFLALSRLDLSFAYPVASMQYVFVFAGARYLLGEQIDPIRVIGLVIICAGVFVISLGQVRK